MRMVPSIGVGVGYGMSAAARDADQPIYLTTSGGGRCRSHFHRAFIGGQGWDYYDPWYGDYYAPRYYVLYDASDTTYWIWSGETAARLALTFERDGKTFRDEFEFRRVKVKG